MLHHAALTLVQAAIDTGDKLDQPEKSKTAFYIAGGVLAVWAVLISAIGITRPEFPDKPGPMRLVIALSALLVIGATGTAVATA